MGLLSKGAYKMSTRKKAVTLSLGERMKMIAYVEKNREDIISGRLSKGQACGEMSRVLGKVLELGHWTTVMGACKVERWGRKKKRQVLAGFDREALIVLVAAVTDLYTVMGEIMPQQLKGLKDALTEELRNENGGGE